MYESRAYDESGEPVVVLVTTGQDDVSRLVSLFNGGPVLIEQLQLGLRLRRQVARHNAGRGALALLKAHGGPDFTGDAETHWWVTDGTYEFPALYGDFFAARGAAIARYLLENPERESAVFTWESQDDAPGDNARELVSDGRRTGLIVAPVTVRVPVPQPKKAGA